MALVRFENIVIGCIMKYPARTGLIHVNGGFLAGQYHHTCTQKKQVVDMKILVPFGTTEGQTRKIARYICSTAEDRGHSCDMYDCAGDDPAPDLADFDAIIVAGSVHQRHHQSAVADFVRTNIAVVTATPNALVSVSLAITLDDGQEEAKAYVSDFSADTGWTPQHVHMAAGAIRYLEYDFFKEFTVQQIVYKGKKTMPPKDGGNPEFTDWQALGAFVTSFLDRSS